MVELLLEDGADSNIITSAEYIFCKVKEKKKVEIVIWLLKNRAVDQLPNASNDLSQPNTAMSIIERVSGNWSAIPLEDELRGVHQRYLADAHLLERHGEANAKNDFFSAVSSLINETGNKAIINVLISNACNNKIANLIRKVGSIGNINTNLDIIKILSRYYGNRFQIFRIIIDLNDDEVLDYILQYTGVNDLSNLDGSILCVAILKQNIAIVDRLLKYKCEVNKPDSNGSTPLIIAAGKGNRAIAELLLSNGADVNLKAKDSGLTALYIAALSQNRYMVDMLLRYGANDNVDTSDDVLKACVQQMQPVGMLNLSTIKIPELKRKVKDIIEEESRIITIVKRTHKYNDTVDDTAYNIC
ncbi:hypothetical protein Trydic_g12435 [Trypoxylus dichotomus]